MDFLSNGFHQLYSELDNDFTSWDYTDTSSTLDGLKVDNIFSSDYYEFVDDQDAFTLNLENPRNSFEEFQSEFIQDLDYLPCSDLPITDLDNTFLEDYVGLPELTNFFSERTPFCNDSCNLFIKESSESVNKFSPEPEPDPGPIPSLRTLTDPEGEKIFPCTYGTCSKVYAKPAHLKAHLRRHLGDKPYVCNWPNCTWKFSRSDELARHRRSHSGIKPYKCTYCTKCFARSDHLNKHLKVHERKMAANKLKGILSNYHHIKPGRRPKNVKNFGVL